MVTRTTRWATAEIDLLIAVFRRWMEEPIGIFYAILIFVIFRIPEQTPDMLTEIMLRDGGGWKRWGDIDKSELSVFFIMSATLALSVWYWTQAILRTEIAIRGGRYGSPELQEMAQQLREFDNAHKARIAQNLKLRRTGIFGWVRCLITEQSAPGPRTPYSVAPFAAATIILVSAATVVVGSLVPLWLGFILMFVVAYLLARRLAQRSDARLLDYSDKWYGRTRVTALLFAAPFSVRMGLPMMVLSIGIGIATTWLPFLDGEAARWITIVTMSLCTGLVLTFGLIYGVDSYLEFTGRELTRKGQRLILAGTLLATLVFYTAISAFFPAANAELLDDLNAAPPMAILAIACSVGPLVALMSVLRDMSERVLSFLVYLTDRLKGETDATLWLCEIRSEDGERSHATRRVGRFVGTVVFAALFLMPPFFWVRTDCDPGGASCRAYSIRNAGPLPQRPDLVTALNAWHDALGRPPAKDRPQVPLLIVAAEGGASRAAGWMLTAMADLARKDPSLARHVFAVSGVSGGSLGAVTYLQNERANGRIIAPPRLEALASEDLLSAAIHRYFFADVLRRPDVFGLMARVKNRNDALEHTFELHWQEAWGVSPQAASSGLIALQQGAAGTRSPAPHMLLNGVDVGSGRRILTSTIAFNGSLPGTIDFFAEFGHDLPASSAVMNSARFPLISPAGRYELANGPAGEKPKVRQIIDGGYFENYGVETALEVIAAIERAAPQLDWDPVPFLLVVSNDVAGRPSCPLPEGTESSIDEAVFARLPDFKDVTLSCRNPDFFPAAAGSDTSVAEGLAPFLGLVGIRAAHGAEALADARGNLCKAAAAPNSRVIADRFYHVALPRPISREHAAPMNWVLDHRVAAFFDVAIREPENQRQLLTLLRDMRQVMTTGLGRSYSEFVPQVPDVLTCP